MINSEELIPVISSMQEEMDMNIEQTKEVFITLAMFVHGYALSAGTKRDCRYGKIRNYKTFLSIARNVSRKH